MSSSWLFLFLGLQAADGFKYFVADRCVFNSSALRDMRFSRSYYYNKIEQTRFCSDVGRFVGFTKYGVQDAAALNRNASLLAAMRAATGAHCLHNARIWYRRVLSKAAAPHVVLSSAAPPGGQHSSMLVCSVFSFYPQKILVSWTRDGLPETSGVTSTDELADGDWYYQVHSHLEYTPRSGEKISCVVEHFSLSEPLVTDWDPSMPKSEIYQFSIGASGLLLGLTLSLAGFIYYKRKARGWILVPNN